MIGISKLFFQKKKQIKIINQYFFEYTIVNGSYPYSLRKSTKKVYIKNVVGEERPTIKRSF